jgi:hypothetical protein
MDGYKPADIDSYREPRSSSHLRHVVAGKVFNKLIGAEEMYHSLDSREGLIPAVRTIAHHGSTKFMDGFPAQHPIFPRP